MPATTRPTDSPPGLTHVEKNTISRPGFEKKLVRITGTAFDFFITNMKGVLYALL